MSRNYFLLYCHTLPDTEFICEYGGPVRLKATLVTKKEDIPFFTDSLYGILEESIIVFENVGKQWVGKEELLIAINWFKNHIKSPAMRIVDGRFISVRNLIRDNFDR
jgi:hypothetical protein